MSLPSMIQSTHPNDDFRFLDVGVLADAEIRLVLDECVPAHIEKGHVPAYRFKICLLASDEPIGHLSFRVKTVPGLESRGHVGYGVEPAFRGKHFAEKACRLVVPLAFRHGLHHLLITCNPENRASRRTCERLGAELIEIVSIHPGSAMQSFSGGDTKRCVYRLDLETT